MKNCIRILCLFLALCILPAAAEGAFINDVIVPEGIHISSFSDGYALFLASDGSWGMIDDSGRIAFGPQRDMAPLGMFSEGRASFCLNGVYGYLDTGFRIAIAPEWQQANDFSQGLAAVCRDGLWTYIDRDGRAIAPPVWQSAGDFSEDLALVQDAQSGLYGFINRRGEVVIDLQWTSAYSFRAGYALVNNGEHSLYIDQSGAQVDKSVARAAQKAADGYRSYYKNGLFGYKDSLGNVAIEAAWDQAEAFSEDRAVVYRDGLAGYIDLQGKVISEPRWNIAHPYMNGLAVVQGTDGWHALDPDGKLIF